MKSYESYGFLQNAKDSYELLRIAMNSCDCDGLLVTANDHVTEKQKKQKKQKNIHCHWMTTETWLC